MAANLPCRGFAKRFLSFVSSSTRNPAFSPSRISARRAVHVSVYDKNPEEHVHHPSIVPDEVIQNQSAKYWTPHPQTGVFGPPTNHTLTAADFHTLAAGAGHSVLELKAFFRPLEDLEKPPHSAF
nr:late embryogenesis abundant protein At5g17165-like [Ipomoea batatas]